MEKSINRNGKFLNPIDRDILDSYFLQFVAGSQPINALAFVLDGLYYGFSDFGYAAYSMVLVGMISSVFLVIAAPLYGLAGVWTGLFLSELWLLVMAIVPICYFSMDSSCQDPGGGLK
ncbi:hypothetical protein RHGRI_005466 [Rhododendron griersonianum]|uniref:Uncharacterized protein n=1 Tax=Rhododendron griersonianum TaxID=479676 RepID=A0AAV6LDD8_9ERIC|nr:hypothetical protein RHGRI_005466 [Rhododendron griersonianum]